jgi:hypothetical protein
VVRAKPKGVDSRAVTRARNETSKVASLPYSIEWLRIPPKQGGIKQSRPRMKGHPPGRRYSFGQARWNGMVPYQAAHNTAHQKGDDHERMVPPRWRWRGGPCRCSTDNSMTAAGTVFCVWLAVMIDRGLGGPGQVPRHGKQNHAATGVRRGQVNHSVRHGLQE